MTIILTFLVTLICLLFGWLLGVKFYDLFGSRYMAALGPLAAFAVGMGFGINHLGLAAGLVAGLIGAFGSTYALWRS